MSFLLGVFMLGAFFVALVVLPCLLLLILCEYLKFDCIVSFLEDLIEKVFLKILIIPMAAGVLSLWLIVANVIIEAIKEVF